jgi:hypothetical protein
MRQTTLMPNIRRIRIESPSTLRPRHHHCYLLLCFAFPSIPFGLPRKLSSLAAPSRSSDGASPMLATTAVFSVSSLMPIMTLPATNIAAPSHHKPGNSSLNMSAPRTAVTIKFAEVLMMLTRTVEDPRVRARVKSPHITALKMRLSAKKSCC